VPFRKRDAPPVQSGPAGCRLVDEPLPQRALGVDVERRGEIVDDEQFGRTHQRARRGRALHLTSGQPDAARADARVESLREQLEIALEHGGADRGDDGRALGVASEQDVLAQRSAEQAR